MYYCDGVMYVYGCVRGFQPLVCALCVVCTFVPVMCAPKCVHVTTGLVFVREPTDLSLTKVCTSVVAHAAAGGEKSRSLPFAGSLTG